jgi:hypothetical protein
MQESDNKNHYKTLSMDDLETVQKRYQERIEKFGVSFNSLNSGDEENSC